MFLFNLFFKWNFRSFPLIVEDNVGFRSLVKFDTRKGQVCPNEISLSLIGDKDFLDVASLHSVNKDWLDPWMVTVPEGFVFDRKSFSNFSMSSDCIVNHMKRMLQDKDYYFKICLDNQLCGFICVNEVTRGSVCSAQIGYWISRDFAGRNIMPVALAMLVDFCFDFLMLHRIEVNICKHNSASLRVVEKLGFRYEGQRSNYIFVNDSWCDHLSFAYTIEDLCCGGVLAKYENGCFC